MCQSGASIVCRNRRGLPHAWKSTFGYFWGDCQKYLARKRAQPAWRNRLWLKNRRETALAARVAKPQLNLKSQRNRPGNPRGEIVFDLLTLTVQAIEVTSPRLPTAAG